MDVVFGPTDLVAHGLRAADRLPQRPISAACVLCAIRRINPGGEPNPLHSGLPVQSPRTFDSGGLKVSLIVTGGAGNPHSYRPKPVGVRDERFDLMLDQRKKSWPTSEKFVSSTRAVDSHTMCRSRARSAMFRASRRQPPVTQRPESAHLARCRVPRPRSAH